MAKCDCQGCLYAALTRTALLGPGEPSPCSICDGTGLSTLASSADASLVGTAGEICLECYGLGFTFH